MFVDVLELPSDTSAARSSRGSSGAVALARHTWPSSSEGGLIGERCTAASCAPLCASCASSWATGSAKGWLHSAQTLIEFSADNRRISPLPRSAELGPIMSALVGIGGLTGRTMGPSSVGRDVSTTTVDFRRRPRCRAASQKQRRLTMQQPAKSMLISSTVIHMFASAVSSSCSASDPDAPVPCFSCARSGLCLEGDWGGDRGGGGDGVWRGKS